MFVPLGWVTSSIPLIQKQKRTYQLEWKGGVKNEPLDLTLYKKDSNVHVVYSIKNEGSYSFKVPKDITKGSAYTYKLAPRTRLENSVVSRQFEVKGRIPMLISVGVPLALVGGGLYYLMSKGETTPEAAVDEKIPDPFDLSEL